MVFLALLALVTMGLLASEAFSSRRMNRSLWRDGFLVTVTRERLGIGSTPSEVEGRPAIPWRTEVWLHGEEGQLPHSLSFVEACLNLPPPERVHLLDGSLYTHAGPADYRELERLIKVMVDYAQAVAVPPPALHPALLLISEEETNLDEWIDKAKVDTDLYSSIFRDAVDLTRIRVVQAKLDAICLVKKELANTKATNRDGDKKLKLKKKTDKHRRPRSS